MSNTDSCLEDATEAGQGRHGHIPRRVQLGHLDPRLLVSSLGKMSQSLLPFSQAPTCPHGLLLRMDPERCLRTLSLGNDSLEGTVWGVRRMERLWSQADLLLTSGSFSYLWSDLGQMTFKYFFHRVIGRSNVITYVPARISCLRVSRLDNHLYPMSVSLHLFLSLSQRTRAAEK